MKQLLWGQYWRHLENSVFKSKVAFKKWLWNRKRKRNPINTVCVSLLVQREASLKWSNNRGISISVLRYNAMRELCDFLFTCITNYNVFFEKNGPTSASFEFIFVFSNTHYNFTTNRYEKICPSSIQCKDSNSQPLEHESPPITTRQGLPPNGFFLGSDVCQTNPRSS